MGWPPGTKPVPEPVWGLGKHWTLNQRESGGSNRYCWVLQSREHLSDLGQAGPGELADFGPALALATQVLKTVCEAQRIYVQLTNRRGHFHLDLVPFYDGDPDIDTQSLMERPPPPGVLRRELVQVIDMLRSELESQSVLAVSTL